VDLAALRRRISMKKLLALGLVGAVAACGGDDSGRVTFTDPFCAEVMPRVQDWVDQQWEAHPVPDDDRYGGTLVLAAIAELAGGMNAATSQSYEGRQHQEHLNLMPLVRYTADLALQPYLAESWEVSEDGTELTFHLREDITWHDGERTDAHDVAFTYLTVTNPETGFPNAAFWDRYVRGPEGVEVVDDFTVTIRLEPHAEFMDAWTTLGILPEHLLGDAEPASLAQHPFGTQCPVGNGPFVFTSHAPQERWVFDVNPAFPEPLGGRPYLDRYVYRIVPEPTTLLTELLTENVHIWVMPPPDMAQRIIDAEHLELVAFPSRNYVFVGWNARRPQLSDPRVRRALTMGTNRQEIVDALLSGYGVVANSGVPPFHWAYDPELELGGEHDPAAAAALLEEAGWVDRDGDGVRENADGLPLSISVKYNQGNRNRQAIAEIMQSQLAEIGVQVRPQVVEFTTLLQQITTPGERDFDGVVMGWGTEFKVDDTDLFHSERSDAPYAWAGTDNPEVDRLLKAIGDATDRDEATDLWAEYQRVIAEEHPYTYFYFSQRLSGVNRRLANVEMDARGEWVNIRDWYFDPASR
jgi:peptide/nickel transport system substrate-binding protein